MMKTKIILALLALLAAIACQDDKIKDTDTEEKAAFILREDYGVYLADSVIFGYDKTKHQMSFSTTTPNFRLQTDNQDEILNIALSEKPVLEKEIELNVNVVNIKQLNSGVFNTVVLKTSLSKAWLWDSKKMTGFVIRTN